MSVYAGERTIDGIVVSKDGAALDSCVEGAYSDIGLDWGFVGGPSRQLSFALLYDHLGDAARAHRLVEAFTVHIAARLTNEWQLESDGLKEIVRGLEAS